MVKLKVNILIYAYILLRYLSMTQLAENLFAPLSTMKAKIIHLIEKTEQTIDHLKFMFSPMPTSEGFMDSLQVDMIERKWCWYPHDLASFSLYLKQHYLSHIRYIFNKQSPFFKILCPNYIPKYWETTKIDVKRTIARMSRNGGIG